jgi:hypothetical protein
MPSGFKITLGWISQRAPGSRGMTLLIAVLFLIAAGLFAVPWDRIFPPAPDPAPVAHTQPLQSPTPSPSPSQVIQVNAAAGAICIVPTSKAKRPLTLVKVP